MSEIEITRVEVTPWDIAQAERHYPPSGWRREAIMDLAQFVAEVRHEARASALEENKAWSEAVATIMARCEALEDEAANELVKAESEHAQGYWRGQKRTAKSIRRELHDLTRALRNGEREG